MKPSFLAIVGAVSIATLIAGGTSQADTNMPDQNAPRLDAAAEQSNTSSGLRSKAQLVDGKGNPAGEIIASQGTNGVLLQIRAEELPAGWHGVHLHQIGNCSDVGVFKASGGHIEGKGGMHGFVNREGTHGGDLPNIYVSSDKRAYVDFFTTAIDLQDLTDSDGAALIIHADPDDYKSQPIGGAGARIACAAFPAM